MSEKKEKKFDIIKRKENTIHSLKEVEHFLNNFSKCKNSVSFFKLFK